MFCEVDNSPDIDIMDNLCYPRMPLEYNIVTPGYLLIYPQSSLTVLMRVIKPKLSPHLSDHFWSGPFQSFSIFNTDLHRYFVSFIAVGPKC